MNAVTAVLHLLFWYAFPLVALALVASVLMMGLRALDRRLGGSRGHRGPAMAGMLLGTVIALGVGSIPLFEREGPSLDADWLRGLGFVAILMIPAVLAFMGLRRPGALLAAGFISVPLCLMSFSLLLFPMLIPAALYFVAFSRAVTSYTPRVCPGAIAALTFVLVVLSFFSLFLNEDPRCYEIVQRNDGTTFERRLPPDRAMQSNGTTIEVGSSSGRLDSSSERGGVIGSGCSSDSVTKFEAGLSIGLLSIATIAATYLSGPGRSLAAPLNVYA